MSGLIIDKSYYVCNRLYGRIPGMKKGRLTLVVFMMILVTDLLESVAQTLLKEGVNGVGMANITLANFAGFIANSVSNPLVLLGLSVYILNFLLWMTILSRVELSVAMPAGSASYILVPVFSMLFLHEAINPARWFGIIFIVAGIYFVSQSTKAKETVV